MSPRRSIPRRSSASIVTASSLVGPQRPKMGSSEARRQLNLMPSPFTAKCTTAGGCPVDGGSSTRYSPSRMLNSGCDMQIPLFGCSCSVSPTTGCWVGCKAYKPVSFTFFLLLLLPATRFGRRNLSLCPLGIFSVRVQASEGCSGGRYERSLPAPRLPMARLGRRSGPPANGGARTVGR